jgi:hypothetical protein
MTTAAEPPAPAPPPYAPVATGQLGETRSVGLSILWAILTLGIYCFYWTYKTHDEIKRRSGQGLGGGIGLLIYVFVGIATPFIIGSEVKNMLEGDGRQSRVSAATGFWILIPLAGPFIWFPKVQGQLNEYWRSLGAPG